MKRPWAAWTDDRIEMLRTLWSTDLTGAEIGARLSVSRNAVLGKALRLGLPARAERMSDADRFERLIDLVADHGVTVPTAAQNVGLPVPIGERMWAALCARMGRQVA